MKPHFLIALSLLTSVSIAFPAEALDVTREMVPGIANLSRLGTVVSCSGAIQVAAVPEIKKMGYLSIINLREANEPGANIEEQESAAKTSGLRYFHIPFNAASPDPAAVDRFIEVITRQGIEPAFIHCFRGGRAATMWFIKRLVVDHWDEDRAEKEAAALGMNNPALREFAVTYARTHKRENVSAAH
jgi:uncharacterized protein (TIGR01244 family)